MTNIPLQENELAAIFSRTINEDGQLVFEWRLMCDNRTDLFEISTYEFQEFVLQHAIAIVANQFTTHQNNSELFNYPVDITEEEKDISITNMVKIIENIYKEREGYLNHIKTLKDINGE